MKHRRVPKDNYQELFRYARSYLSSAFPNPNREDCPEDAALITMAADPLTADPYVEEHVSFCSPCFTRYMAVLDDLGGELSHKATNATLTWVVATATAVIIFATALILWGKLGLHVGQEAILDLRNASVNRGVESGGNQHSEQVPTLSRSSKNVEIYLPHNGEGAYELRIIDEDGTVFASATAVGKSSDSSTKLLIKIDFSRAAPGLYSLLVKHGAKSNIYRIRLE